MVSIEKQIENSYLINVNNNELSVSLNNDNIILKIYNKRKEDNKERISFNITKENSYLFNLFNSLYKDFVFEKKLFNKENDNNVDILSDDIFSSYSSKFSIKKLDNDDLLVSFTKSKIDETYDVVIKKENHLYDRLYIPIIRMINKLNLDYEDYKQVTLDEMIYEQNKIQRVRK